MLWAVFTLIAAAAQTARNAMQRELTATLGTVGATHVRFLFGFPFRATVPVRPDSDHRRPPAGNAAGVLALGDWWCTRPDRRHCVDAVRNGRTIVRRGLRLHQDRAGAGGAVWPDLPRRPFHAARCHRHSDCNRRRDCHVAEAGRRPSRYHAVDAGRARRRHNVRAVRPSVIAARFFRWALRISCWPPRSLSPSDW